MKTLEEHDDDILLPTGISLKPISPNEAHETLFPTSPFNERPDPNDDSPLLPPLMDQ